MFSTRPAFWMTTALLLGISASFAQQSDTPDVPAPTPTPAASVSHARKIVRQPTPEEDIRAIRQMVEEQALKIDAISQQVSKLATDVNSLSQSVQASNSKTSEPPTAPAVPSPSPTTSGASPNAAVAPAAPALNTGNNPVHVVAKGETLTSIARHSKVTVAELLKLNKIENDRALQIGQTLVLPTPKPVETPANNEPK